MLYKTPLGLNIRATGENPNAASSVGVSVLKIKYTAIAFSGLMSGFGGAFMSMAYAQGWSQDMVSGRGFIALAAQAMGAKRGRIIRKHILPNCMSVIIISTALQIPSAIFTESFLSFIGLGVQAPMPSLGSLANSARAALQAYPYKMVFPAVGICLIVLSFNLLGDGLRDAFDPKLRK